MKYDLNGNYISDFIVSGYETSFSGSACFFDGYIYAHSDSDIYRIDPDTGTGTSVKPLYFGSVGAIASVDDGLMVVTSDGKNLVKLDKNISIHYYISKSYGTDTGDPVPGTPYYVLCFDDEHTFYTVVGTETSLYLVNYIIMSFEPDWFIESTVKTDEIYNRLASIENLTFDSNNYLQVNVKATVNPSNLDVALSTRASESTLSSILDKFDVVASKFGEAYLYNSTDGKSVYDHLKTIASAVVDGKFLAEWA